MRSRNAAATAAIVAVALAVIQTALAAAEPQSLRFTRLSVEHGLSQGSVLQILQDRKGLLWFATQEGLNRYDGYRFTVHRARDRDGFLRDHEINALIDDAQGNLWVGTSRGLYRHDLDTGRFDAAAPPVDGLAILKLARSADGRIWFAASDGRSWILDPADPQRRARSLSDGAFATLTGVTALAPGPGAAMWAAASGRLYKSRTGGSRRRTTHGSAGGCRRGVDSGGRPRRRRVDRQARRRPAAIPAG